jgi:hypothetical protein
VTDSGDDPRRWPRGYAAAEQAQMLRLAGLTLAEKLDWLEEAQRLVQRIDDARTVREEPPGPG